MRYSAWVASVIMLFSTLFSANVLSDSSPTAEVSNKEENFVAVENQPAESDVPNLTAEHSLETLATDLGKELISSESSEPNNQGNNQLSPEGETDEKENGSVEKNEVTETSLTEAVETDQPETADPEAEVEVFEDDEVEETSGFAFFRAAGRTTIFEPGISTSTPGEIFMLGGNGEVKRVVDAAPDDSKPAKLVNSYDIPYGKFTRNGGVRKWERIAGDVYTQYFDAFAYTKDKFFALSTNDHNQNRFHDDPYGRVNLYEYDRKQEKWYVHGPNGRQVLRWNTPTGKLTDSTVSAVPNYEPKGENYTFNDSYTNFIAGTALADGTYIFAGTDVSGANQTAYMKLFALTSNGVIKYLGSSALPSAGGNGGRVSQDQGDIVADMQGNLYVSNAVTEGGNSIRVNVNKISADVLKKALNNPVATWRNRRWVSQRGGGI